MAGTCAHQGEVLGGEAADAGGVGGRRGHRQEVDNAAIHRRAAAEGARESAVEVERDVARREERIDEVLLGVEARHERRGELCMHGTHA